MKAKRACAFLAAFAVCGACRAAVGGNAAMPLVGSRVVAADEFWLPPSCDRWPPTLVKSKVHWGLAAAQDLTNAL